MASSNPFRKKGPQGEGRFPPIEAIDTSVAQASLPPPPVSFGREDHDSDGSDSPPAKPATTGKKPKVVKKVRVLSPPPLSPDSPEWPYNHAPPSATAYDGSTLSNGTQDDFNHVQEAAQPASTQQVISIAAVPQGPPANPFSKTLFDLENAKKEQELKEERREEGAVLKAASRASLNVDSFRRLLMTGDAGDGRNSPGHMAVSETTVPALDSVQDATKTPPLTYHDLKADDEADLSDASITVQIGQRKKAPPPPPSSRHGKSIKSDIEYQESAKVSPEISKATPGHPVQGSAEGEVETFPAIDSSAHVAEPESEQASNARKSAPAPPPPRGRGRSGSKGQTPNTIQKAPQDGDGESLKQLSETAPRSTNNHRESMIAPAPPPPRRPHPGPKGSGQQLHPTSATSNSQPEYTNESELSAVPTPQPEEAAPTEVTTRPDAHAAPVKVSVPPPPPARHTSVRRPPSASSNEAQNRHASGEAAKPRDGIPPPPPPSRKRGSSKGSVDGPFRKSSADSVPKPPADPGQGDSILADLDALQREVDALRGKLS